MDSFTEEQSIINGFDRDYRMKRLSRIFEENADSLICRNKPAVIFNNKSETDCILTYQQLNQASNRFAALLIDRINTYKLKRNEDGDWIIAVCMPPSHELIITLLAIWKAGAAYLPIDVTFPQNRIDHILQEAKPTLVIFDSKSVELNFFNNSRESLAFSDCLAFSSIYSDENIPNENMLEPISNCLSIILYTSGSSGVPKGVRLPYTAVLNRLQWQWETFPYSSTEQICIFKTALTFVDSVSEIWSPLLMKKTVLVVPKSITTNPELLVATLEQYKIERLVLVPTLLKSILIYLSIAKNNFLLRKLKLWICSGETLQITLVNEFYKYFPENKHLLCNFYGSTEIMGDATYFKCSSLKQLLGYENTVPIGSPISNTMICILDAEGCPVKKGEIGELFVSGANLAHGYVNGRENESFIENMFASDLIYSRLYRTGDYASIRKGGIVQYEGRTDSQVKIRGHRVDLSEIEKHLLDIIEVEKVIVLCYHPGQSDQSILAFVSIEPKSCITNFEIERTLNRKLPEYMIPQLVYVNEIPLLVNGKIDRQSLLKLFENSNNNGKEMIDLDYDGVLESEMVKAKILFETISEVIGKSVRCTISLKSNFYALGGNSLNSIYTIAKLHDQGYAIDISSFITAVNLKGIMNGMTELKEGHSETRIYVGEDINFSVEALRYEHKNETIRFLSPVLASKSSTIITLNPQPTLSEINTMYSRLWEFFVEQNCSFVIKDETDRIIGVSLNHDAFVDQPSTTTSHLLNISDQFFLEIEWPFIDQLPKNRSTLYSNILATHERLNAQENVSAVTFMENELIRLAREKNCYGILATNTHPITQQLAKSVFGFETLHDYQLNKYVTSDGKNLFINASDSDRAIIQFKKL